MTSPARAAARLSVPTVTGRCVLSARARSPWRTVAQASLGATPAFNSPCSKLVPIFPNPSTATRWFVIATSSQVVFEQRSRVGLLVAVLHDHRRVEGETPASGSLARRRSCAGHHHGAGRNL